MILKEKSYSAIVATLNKIVAWFLTKKEGYFWRVSHVKHSKNEKSKIKIKPTKSKGEDS